MKFTPFFKLCKKVLYGIFLQCIMVSSVVAAEDSHFSMHLLNLSIFQDLVVKGRVVDAETNEGMPGVTVLEEGTGNGTITDLEGNYRITVQSGANLVFSFVGYASQSIPVTSQSEINVELSQDLQTLKELVVIGYGEVEREDLTGSVVTVDAQDIQRANKVNAFQALQGQVAGVNIQAADNKPGGGFNIRIRGSNTINSSQSIDNGGFSAGQNPLFVVDGIFVDDINFLNPSDIERVDVLKDASSTAIYGSRGTNGVVIIQTKKGMKGDLSISYDNYFGVKQAYNLPDLFNGPEFVQFMRDAVVGINYASGNLDFREGDVNLSDYLRPNELENIQNNNYTDWVDLIQNNGFQTNHNVGLSGGSEKTSFGFGLAYTKDEGTFEGENYERVNLRGNINSKFSDYVTIGYNNYATFSKRDVGSLEGFRSAYRLRPTGTAYDENGEPLFFPLEGETFITNPLFEPANMLREVRTLSYIGNLSLVIHPTDNLTLTSNLSPNVEFSRSGEYRGQFSKSTSGNIGNTRAEVINQNRMSFTWDNIVNYKLDLNANNALDATFIYSRFLDRYEDYVMQRRNFTTDNYLFYNIDAGSSVRDVNSGYSKQTLESFAGRLNYNLLGRYLFTLTGRYDGSSMLSDQNKWAFFPSAAFAWRLTDESFMQNQDLFHNLKLRLSYGQTGNNGAGGGLVPLGSQAFIGTGFTNIDDQVTQTGFVTNLANQELTWERTTEYNFGLDFGLFRNRVYGSLDIYNRQNSGIIFFRPLPNVSGYSGVFDNVGEATNKGIELSLNTVNITNENFSWKTNFNFARNVNEVTRLYGDLNEIQFSAMDAPYVHRVGEPVGSAFTWIYDGIWQLDEVDEARSYGQEPGQVRVRDINNDGVLDDNDRTAVGSSMPDWTAGITNTINLKNFDLSVFVHTSQGATSFSYFHRSHAWDGHAAPARFNGLQTNYWTPQNPSDEWYQPGNSGRFSEALLFRDVSFVKVGFITMGYTMPQSAIERIGMKSLRFYVTAQNPFTFTDYEGWDPENAARNSYGAAYMARTFMGGLNVRF